MSRKLIVRNTIKLDAEPARVWEALTRPELTKRYMFGCEAVSDWKVGHPVLWKAVSNGEETVYVKGEVVALSYGRRLAFTAIDPHGAAEDIPANYTTVVYELSTAGKQTVLSVSQGDFATVADGEKRYGDCIKGWETALDGLKSLLNKK